MTGTLVLVGTPIGNLDDLSTRATAVLGRAEVIACEDTRRTGKLLELAGVDRRGRFVLLNDHTEADASEELLGVLAGGSDVVVVSDAGMPAISDPGERLVRAAVDAGHDVSVVPGPSAALCALVLSGMTTSRFVFEGFLPRKGARRRDRLAELAAEPRTVLLHESPHRAAATLADLASVAGPDRGVAVGRELTKLHEEVWRGSLGAAVAHFRREPARGEVTIVLAGAGRPHGPGDDEVLAVLEEERASGASTRDAVDRVSSELGVGRKRVYDLARRSRPAAGEEDRS